MFHWDLSYKTRLANQRMQTMSEREKGSGKSFKTVLWTAQHLNCRALLNNNCAERSLSWRHIRSTEKLDAAADTAVKETSFI